MAGGGLDAIKITRGSVEEEPSTGDAHREASLGPAAVGGGRRESVRNNCAITAVISRDGGGKRTGGKGGLTRRGAGLENRLMREEVKG